MFGRFQSRRGLLAYYAVTHKLYSHLGLCSLGHLVAYAKQAGFYRAEKEELLARDGFFFQTWREDCFAFFNAP